MILKFLFRGLGVIVIAYDAVFLVQHYILYPHHHPMGNINEERRRLIVEGRVPINDEDVLSDQEDFQSETSSILSRKPINANLHYGSTSN